MNSQATVNAVCPQSSSSSSRIHLELMLNDDAGPCGCHACVLRSIIQVISVAQLRGLCYRNTVPELLSSFCVVVDPWYVEMKITVPSADPAGRGAAHRRELPMLAE